MRRALLGLLLIALALANLCRAQDSTEDGRCSQSRVLEQAQRTVTRNGAVVDMSEVRLLDPIVRAWMREDTSIRYRIDLSMCAHRADQALSLYRIGAPYRVSADGQPLAAIQPFANARPNVYNGRVPALFHLPLGVRTLDIELAAVPYVPNGLIRVALGPQQELIPAMAADRNGLTEFNDVSSAVILMIGLLALTMWLLRPQERQILWFGAACLAWAVRGLAYQTFVMPWDALAFEQINPWLVLVTVSFITTSTLYSLNAMTRRRALWLSSLVGLITLGFAVSLSQHRGAVTIRGMAFLVAFVLMIALVTALVRQRSLGRRRTLLLLGGYVALMAGATHDIGMVTGVVSPDHWPFVTPGFTVMLLSYTVSVGQYLVRNLNRAERVNEELEQTIRAKTLQLEASYALLRESERESARTQEREHLLRDMHDGLGASLMTALRGVERGALAREQVMASLQDSLDDLRLLMDSADMGRQLQGALATWRNRWDPRLTALNIDLDWLVDENLDQVKLHSDAVLQVMRILQEATANVVKHAGATRMQLRVQLEGSVLAMTVQDNGNGLPDQPARTGARGLKNMASRAALLGASLTVQALAAPLSGTRVALRLPL